MPCMLLPLHSFLSYSSLLSFAQRLRSFPGPCLGRRRGDDVESVREHVEDDGTPSSGQFGLHCLCSVVPISVLLGAQVGCLDIAFIPFVAPVHQKHKMTRLPRQSRATIPRDTDRSGDQGVCRRVIFAAGTLDLFAAQSLASSYRH